MPRFDILAFDADDTLWHTERLYVGAQDRFKQLLSHYHSRDWVEARLYTAEMRNLGHFGYGIKAFALSMIETALELTEARISGTDIQTILGLAKDMMSAEVELLEHVAATLPALADRYPLMIITKGDLRDQETKIARSGLAAHFQRVEIVSDKSRDSYAALLGRHGLAAERFVMIGNSLRSDILPVLALGATAVYIPYPLTWAHEAAEPPSAEHPGFYELAHVGLLPGLLTQLENGQ